MINIDGLLGVFLTHGGSQSGTNIIKVVSNIAFDKPFFKNYFLTKTLGETIHVSGLKPPFHT